MVYFATKKERGSLGIIRRTVPAGCDTGTEFEVVMQAHPFRLARPLDARVNENAGGHLHAAGACRADASLGQPGGSRRRTRLTELDSHLHCSIIGTCLSTHELRKLVPRFTELDRQRR